MITHNFKSLKYKVATSYEARLAICKGHKENLSKSGMLYSLRSLRLGDSIILEVYLSQFYPSSISLNFFMIL